MSPNLEIIFLGEGTYYFTVTTDVLKDYISIKKVDQKTVFFRMAVQTHIEKQKLSQTRWSKANCNSMKIFLHN